MPGFSCSSNGCTNNVAFNVNFEFIFIFLLLLVVVAILTTNFTITVTVTITVYYHNNHCVFFWSLVFLFLLLGIRRDFKVGLDDGDGST